MLILLAPAAVSVLAITARALKTWKCGRELRDNDTAVVKALVLEDEWTTIETSDSATEVRGALHKAVTRHQLMELALRRETIQ